MHHSCHKPVEGACDVVSLNNGWLSVTVGDTNHISTGVQYIKNSRQSHLGITNKIVGVFFFVLCHFFDQCENANKF